MLRAQLLQAGVAVHAGHLEVEQHRVGARLRDQREHLVAALCDTDDLEPLGYQRNGQRLRIQRVVIDQHHASRRSIPHRRISLVTHIPQNEPHVHTTCKSCETYSPGALSDRVERNKVALVPMLTTCSRPDCSTLTIGPLCIDHESPTPSQPAPPSSLEPITPAGPLGAPRG